MPGVGVGEATPLNQTRVRSYTAGRRRSPLRTLLPAREMRHAALVCLVALALAGLASAQICPVYATGQTLWSATYGNLAAGANVTITTTVWLDASTPVLNNIEIQSGGSLYFKPGSGAITLRAKQIYVRPGGTPRPQTPRPSLPCSALML